MSVAKRLLRKIKEMDSFFWGPCNDHLETEQSEKTDRYSWKDWGCKVYPSSISSIYTCPKKYIEETVHTPAYFQLVALESMEVGKEVHKAYQNVVKQIPGYCQRPDYSYFRSLYPEEADKLEQKLEDIWPEIPILDPPSGFSMRLDVAKANPLMIIDIKTIGQEDYVYDKKTEKLKSNCWEDLKAKLPKTEHKLQVSFYLHFARKYRIFPEQPNMGGIAYINTRLGNTVNKHEEGFEYTDIMDQMIASWVQNETEHRQAWFNNEKIPCKYQYCSDHGGAIL